MLPALTLVWATRTLAHGMQIQRLHDALQILVILSAKEAHLQPRGPRMPIECRIDRCSATLPIGQRSQPIIRRVVRNNGKWRGHVNPPLDSTMPGLPQQAEERFETAHGCFHGARGPDGGGSQLLLYPAMCPVTNRLRTTAKSILCCIFATQFARPQS